MKKVSAFIMFSLIWLVVPAGAFAQYDKAPPEGATVTAYGRQEATALLQFASVATYDSSATSQNRGDPLMPLLYFGTINTDTAIAVRPISIKADNRYAALVILVQAEGGPQPEKAEEADEDEEDEEFPDDDEFPGDETPATIADPLEPLNRAFFHFNDKLYFWFLRPLAIGYRAVAPEPVRVSFNNFFRNLEFPVRFFSCLLQGKQFEAGEEMRRFSINTFMGLGGFFDVASTADIKKYDEDLGQVLGVWGMGPGFYINWPLLGPSNVRDTIGFIGDRFLYPVSYIFDPTGYTFALAGLDILNQTSLRLGDYEDLKEAAFDPYIAMRDAFYQNRLSKIKD